MRTMTRSRAHLMRNSRIFILWHLVVGFRDLDRENTRESFLKTNGAFSPSYNIRVRAYRAERMRTKTSWTLFDITAWYCFSRNECWPQILLLTPNFLGWGGLVLKPSHFFRVGWGSFETTSNFLGWGGLVLKPPQISRGGEGWFWNHLNFCGVGWGGLKTTLNLRVGGT